MKTKCSIAVLVVTLGIPFSSLADIPLVYDVENTGTNCTPPPLPTLGNLPFIQPLPDPFNWASDPLNLGGTRSTNFVDWECRRNEIMAQIEHYEIGTKPTVDPSQVTAGYTSNSPTSGTLTVNVTVGTNTLTLTCPVTLPSGSGPFPVCIGMDSPYGALPSSLFTGRHIAGITFFESQVTTYGSPLNTDPFFRLYGPTQNTYNTGQYAAWSWGISRVIDGLYKLNGTLGAAHIDLNHIAVTGCSYAGKMALFAGALDERIALTIAQESGGGGANSWRFNQTQPAGTVEDIDNTDYNWFANQLNQFAGNNVSYLPEDHHELDALVAPRALYVTGNTDYTWLGNPSCFVCSMAAQQVYKTLGIADRFGFNIDGGHMHCFFPSDQTSDLAYFLDKFMSGETNLSSVIATYPNGYTNINYVRWYEWWGTTNPVFPTLSLNIPTGATEGDGTLAGQGSVSMNFTVTKDLLVDLASSDTSEVTVPASVVIPVEHSNAVFDLTILDDGLLSGNQAVTITATSPDFSTTAQANITVHDNETTTLSVTLPASALKSAGMLANAGSLSVGTAVGKNVTVSLASSDLWKLTVPPTTVIAAGQTSAVFNLNIVDNKIIDGPQTVSVTAHVPHWTDGSNAMTIVDDNPLPDHFAWNVVPSPQYIGEPIPVTITAQGAAGNTLDYRLGVTLDALRPGTTPGTNTILNSPVPDQSGYDGFEYSLGYAFTPGTNLAATQVRHYFGDKVSIWTASGQLLGSASYSAVPGTWADTALTQPIVLAAGNTYRVAVHEANQTFYFNSALPAGFADGTINFSCDGVGDVFPTNIDSVQWFSVDLRYSRDVSPVTMGPLVTGNFTNGIWSGTITVLQAASNVTLRATAGPGSSGVSLPFNALSRPKLAITILGSSVVLSWPVAAAGFNLEQATTFGNWSVVPGTPAAVGDQYYVTNAIGTTNTYYRLHKP